MTDASGVWSPMRSRRESSRSACSKTFSGMSASASFCRYSSTTDASSSPSSLRMDSSCLRRMYSRCCFSTPDSTSSWMRRRTCISASRSRWSSSASIEPLADVHGLEELNLLLEGEVGRVPGGVGERAGLADRADEGGDAARRRRAARGSPRRRRGTRPRARAAGRRNPCRRGAPRRRRRVGRQGRWPRRPRRRGAGRTAQPHARRRAAGCDRSPARPCPTFAYSSSCLGTRNTVSSSPTSTVRVTLMFGKTTMSSRGTSNSLVTFSLTFLSLGSLDVVQEL